MLDAFENDALRGGHVIGHAREDVARALAIKPSQRQVGDLPMKLPAQIKDHALFEGAVYPRADVEEELAQEERTHGQRARFPDAGHVFARDEVIHKPLHHAGKHDDQ